jgi:predicted ATPase
MAFRRRNSSFGMTRELLAPIYGWFTDGFDTRDLEEAKALLEAFGA